MKEEVGGRRWKSRYRAECLSAIPSSWYRGGQYRCTWPGGVRALVDFVVYRPKNGKKMVACVRLQDERTIVSPKSNRDFDVKGEKRGFKLRKFVAI